MKLNESYEVKAASSQMLKGQKRKVNIQLRNGKRYELNAKCKLKSIINNFRRIKLKYKNIKWKLWDAISDTLLLLSMQKVYRKSFAFYESCLIEICLEAVKFFYSMNL